MCILLQVTSFLGNQVTHLYNVVILPNPKEEICIYRLPERARAMLPGQDNEEVSFTELLTSNVMLIGSPQHFFSLYKCLDVPPSPSPELELQVVVDCGDTPPPKIPLAFRN